MQMGQPTLNEKDPKHKKTKTRATNSDSDTSHNHTANYSRKLTAPAAVPAAS